MSTSLFLRRVLQQTSSLRLITTRFNSSTVESKTTNEPPVDPQFKNKIDDFVKTNKIAIFIKGEPDAPRMNKQNSLFFSFFFLCCT